MSELDLLNQINALEARLRDLEGREYTKSGEWTPYHDDSTIVGWGSFTTKQIYYKKVGKLIFVQFYLAGTSDDTTSTFTLPDASASGVSYILPVVSAQDNGGTLNVGRISLGPSLSTITLYPTPSANTWTASGNKQARGEFWYISA
jgi:hypothetical protein